jgi:transposase
VFADTVQATARVAGAEHATRVRCVEAAVVGQFPLRDAWKLLREIPFIGPIRAALLIALMQTPHRFRTKRQLGTYSGFEIETHSSAEQRFAQGELQRAKKPASIRGLNHNHELKNLFKDAATVAAAKAGPFKEFYDALVAKGIRPEMARLTLARKMAAITLLVWKKEVRFDAQHLKPQTA